MIIALYILVSVLGCLIDSTNHPPNIFALLDRFSPLTDINAFFSKKLVI